MKSGSKLEKHIIYLNELLQQTAREFGWKRDDQQLLEVINSILFAIRNRLPFETSLQFMNLLPLPFKALYVHEWTISEQTPEPLQHMDDLLDEIEQLNPSFITKLKGGREAVKQLVEALFRVISYHISNADLETMLNLLPEDIKFYFQKNEVGNFNLRMGLRKPPHHFQPFQ